MDNIKKKRVEKANKELTNIIVNLDIPTEKKLEIIDAVANLIKALGKWRGGLWREDESMTEYLMELFSSTDIKILEDNGIDWYPDDLYGNYACFDDESEYKKALKLLRRKIKKGKHKVY